MWLIRPILQIRNRDLCSVNPITEQVMVGLSFQTQSLKRNQTVASTLGYVLSQVDHSLSRTLDKSLNVF